MLAPPAITFVGLRSREALSFGVMYLAAVLQRRGTPVQLLLAEDGDEVLRRFRAHPTPLVAFSATTGLHRTYAAWGRRLKAEHAVHTLFGGPHPTYFPDFVQEPGVDAICRGEGEEALPDFLAALAADQGLPSAPVPGWRHWHRETLLDGGLRPPVTDLNALPSPDWALYFGQNPVVARHPVKSFLASRGCPYRCSYCFTREWNALYRPFGARPVRVRDPEAVVHEIAEVRRRWGVRLVWFLDSNFACQRAWLRDLLVLYRRRIGLPFFCKVRPNAVKAGLVEELVEAGCTAVGLGIEAGDVGLRNDLLERGVSDDQILKACHAFVDRGVRVMSFNMVGLPGERYPQARRTLELNVEARVDYAMTMFLQPFPGTEIARRAQAMGLFDGDFARLEASYFQPSPIRFASPEDRRRIVNLQRLLALSVAFPEVRRHIDRLTALPENAFYLQLFKTFNHHAFHRVFYRAEKRRC